MPEHQPREMPEHEQYEDLCALAAGGLLEAADFVDFQAHMKECSQCRIDYQEMSDLVTRELPQTEGSFRQKRAEMRAKPLEYSRQRFLRRARSEGVVFSPEAMTPARSGAWYFRPVTLLAPVVALVILAVGLEVYHFRATPDSAQANYSAAAQQIAELKRENAALGASRSQLNESLAAEQLEIQNLHARLEGVTATAQSLRRDGEPHLQP